MHLQFSTSIMVIFSEQLLCIIAYMISCYSVSVHLIPLKILILVWHHSRLIVSLRWHLSLWWKALRWISLRWITLWWISLWWSLALRWISLWWISLWWIALWRISLWRISLWWSLTLWWISLRWITLRWITLIWIHYKINFCNTHTLNFGFCCLVQRKIIDKFFTKKLIRNSKFGKF